MASHRLLPAVVPIEELKRHPNLSGPRAGGADEHSLNLIPATIDQPGRLGQVGGQELVLSRHGPPAMPSTTTPKARQQEPIQDLLHFFHRSCCLAASIVCHGMFAGPSHPLSFTCTPAPPLGGRPRAASAKRRDAPRSDRPAPSSGPSPGCPL